MVSSHVSTAFHLEYPRFCPRARCEHAPAHRCEDWAKTRPTAPPRRPKRLPRAGQGPTRWKPPFARRGRHQLAPHRCGGRHAERVPLQQPACSWPTEASSCRCRYRECAEPPRAAARRPRLAAAALDVAAAVAIAALAARLGQPLVLLLLLCMHCMHSFARGACGRGGPALRAAAAAVFVLGLELGTPLTTRRCSPALTLAAISRHGGLPSSRRGGGGRRGGRRGGRAARGSRRVARGCGSARAAGGGAPRVCRGCAQRGRRPPPSACRFLATGVSGGSSQFRVSRRAHTFSVDT